jgi:ribosomal peptide maturation radical SAM protein 1
MPWASIGYPSFTAGLLKALLAKKNMAADVFYLNLHLAKRMDLNIYEAASQLPFAGDIVFAQAAFGLAATEEGLGDLIRTSKRSHFVPRLSRVFPKIRVAQVVASLAEAAREIVPGFIEDCLDRISWGDYAVVGFISTFNQHVAALALARRLKERFPTVKTVFGGANLWDSMGRETLRACEWVDYVINGDGDCSFPRLVANILDGTPFLPVPGVSFRRDGELFFSEERYPLADMNELPLPDYTDYIRELADTGLTDKVGRPTYCFESSRGCWWGEKVQCTFCGVNGPTLAYRRKASANVVKELAYLASTYGADNFISTDCVPDPEFCQTLFPALQQYQTDRAKLFKIFYEVKASLTKEELAVMKAAGVDLVQCGIESLNSNLLRLMRKGLTALENIRFLKWCREKRITVNWNMLYCIPGEQKGYYDGMLRVLPLVSHLEPPVSLSPITLQRFSAYHKFPGRYDITNIRPSQAYERIYPPDKVNLEEIAYYFDYDYGGFHADSDTTFEALRRVIDMWTESFNSRIAFFEYAYSEGGIELLDSRPADGETVIPRRLVLAGLKARIFLYCDDIRSLQEIKTHLGTEDGIHPTNIEVQKMLDELVEDNIIYGEDGRYLSLATYRPPEMGPLFIKIPLPGK